MCATYFSSDSLRKTIIKCGPFSNISPQALFCTINDLLESDSVAILEPDYGGNYKCDGKLCYPPKTHLYQLVLKSNSKILQEFHNFNHLIINPNEIPKYQIEIGTDIKAFLATSFVDSDGVQRIFFAAKYNVNKSNSKFVIIYDHQKVELIEPIVACLRVHRLWSEFKDTLDSRNKSKAKKLLKQFEDVEDLLQKAKDLCQEKDKNIDVIIDVLERGIELGKYEHEIANIYDEKIIPYFNTLATCIKPFISISKHHTKPRLELSHSFLLSYFLFVTCDTLFKEHVLKQYSPKEKIELYRSLGKAIEFYLYTEQEKKKKKEKFLRFSLKDFDLSEYIIALCHLMGEYSTAVLGIERQFDLENHLRSFVSSQAVLYSTKTKYRDHLFHMVNICFLGLLLLNSKVKSNLTFTELISSKSALKDSKQLLRNWVVACLLHDVGLVIELHRVIQDEVMFIRSPEIDNFESDIEKVLKNGTQSLNKAIAEKLGSIGANAQGMANQHGLNHGTISAVHIVHILESKFGENTYNSIRYYLPAIQAVLTHDLYERDLNIVEEPISVLLALCDELHDWDRPTVESLTLNEKIAAAVQFRNPLWVESQSILKVMHIETSRYFNPFKGTGYLSKICELNFLLDYSEVEKGVSFYPIYTWLMKSYRLQRLNLRLNLVDLIDVNLTLVTPAAGKIELDVLKDNRRRGKIWYFDKWFAIVEPGYKKLMDKNGLLCAEQLIINIGKLQEEQPITKNPQDDLDKLREMGP